MNTLRLAVGVHAYAPDVLSVRTFRALLYQGVDDAHADVDVAPPSASPEDQAAMEQRDPTRNKKLRFAVYTAVVNLAMLDFSSDFCSDFCSESGKPRSRNRAPKKFARSYFCSDFSAPETH